MSSTDCPSPRSSTKAESSALTKVAYTPVGWAGHRFRSRVSNEGSPRWLSGCDRPVSHPLPEAETTGDRRRRPPNLDRDPPASTRSPVAPVGGLGHSPDGTRGGL